MKPVYNIYIRHESRCLPSLMAHQLKKCTHFITKVLFVLFISSTSDLLV